MGGHWAGREDQRSNCPTSLRDFWSSHFQEETIHLMSVTEHCKLVKIFCKKLPGLHYVLSHFSPNISMAERQTLKMFCFLENLYFGWWQLITLPVLQINLVLTFTKENCAYLHSDAFSIKRSNKSCLQSPAEEIEEISFWQNSQKAIN